MTPPLEKIGDSWLAGCPGEKYNQAMKTVTLSATFDGQNIRLEEDYPLRKDVRLLVTVLPDELERERGEWTRLALQGLARAYGPEEPDYPDNLIQEPNPQYDPR